MKNGIIVIISLLCLAGITFGQGSLTPPSAPTPTMKTLEQVEPRIPISTTTTISSPGSYYLTTNIVTSGGTPGITISADNVTVDMNGFSILGSGATGNGISIYSGVNNVVVQNGTIRDCYYHGIYAANTTNCIFRNLRSLNNARRNSAYIGIRSGSCAQVKDCLVSGNHGDGIVAQSDSIITGNSILDNGYAGLRIIGTGTYIANNIVKGNSDNYDLSDGNQLNILLCEIPESLDWSCSVKLAGTLTCTNNGVNGITINADDVSIDLDGHTLIGPGTSSGNGIYQAPSCRNLSVKNGKVTGWSGTDKGGIYAYGKSTRIHGIQVSTNCYGIHTGVNSTINDCAAYNNTSNGIDIADSCTISDCTAYKNSGDGIRADHDSTINDCTACYNDNNGITGGEGCSISDCIANYNGNTGITMSRGCTISDCAASENSGDGICVYSDCRVVGNTCDHNGSYSGDGAGIHVELSDNRIDGNNVTDNDRGIDVDHSDNFIIRNTASGNTINYDIVANNKVGVIVSAPNSGAISGSTGGSGVGSTNPWANFSF